MFKEVADTALKAAKYTVSPSLFLIEQIIEATSKKTEISDPVSAEEIAKLRLEAERQELQMRMAEAQARFAQEIAIARRIETAEEVEMEEFYEYKGEGQLGAKIDETGVSFGVSGSGRRVSKRIIRFTGKIQSENDLSSPEENSIG